jgi:putative sterol carrier protein
MHTIFLPLGRATAVLYTRQPNRANVTRTPYIDSGFVQRTLKISTPEQLASLLAGKSDPQIEALLTENGIDGALDEIFAYVARRFSRAKSARARAVIQWNLNTPSGIRPYQVTVDSGGVCSAARGSDRAPATVVFTARAALFLRLISGQRTGLEAASRGELKIEGDQTIAILHQSWFDFGKDLISPKISSPSELSRLIEGRSNAEIEMGIEAVGIDSVLDQLFRGLVERFLPNKGPRRRTVAQFTIRTTQGPRAVQFVADRHGATVRREAVERADFTITTDLADLLRIGAGKLDPIRAFAYGKLKLRGNLFLAAGFTGWFDLKR